jgi:hypothetical protein
VTNLRSFCDDHGNRVLAGVGYTNCEILHLQLIGPSSRLACQLDGGFSTLIRKDFDFTPTHPIAMLNTGTKGFAHCLLCGKARGELINASAAICQFTLSINAREKAHPIPRVGGMNAFEFNQVNSNGKHLATFRIIIPQQCQMSKKVEA